MLAMQLGQTIRHRLEGGLCLVPWLTPLPGISVLQRTPNGQLLSTRGKATALAAFDFVSSGFHSQERKMVQSLWEASYPLSDHLCSEKQGHTQYTDIGPSVPSWAAFPTNCPDDFLSGL